MPRLWYFPIESYEERYTCHLSGPNGFWETFLKRNQINYVAIRPEQFNIESGRIRIGKGQVLDTYKRCVWAMDQIKQFLWHLDVGDVKDGDVLFIEDFWHPGFEALPYARDMYGIKFKIYAWCHAQSVDPSDFTAKKGMGPWMRYFEQGIAKSLAGIFVNDVELKLLLNDPENVPGLFVNQCPIYPLGVSYDSQWVGDFYAPLLTIGDKQYMGGMNNRDNIVVFASRWDSEKNPQFYCSLAETMLRDNLYPDLKFYVTSGFKTLVSDQRSLVRRARDLELKFPGRFIVADNLSKLDYFKLLCRAKVHFNCADHDFVSYSLCESVQFGCMPLFPDYKTYPAALLYNQQFLYKRNDLSDAIRKLDKLLSKKTQGEIFVHQEAILTRHNNAIPYAARIMGLL